MTKKDVLVSPGSARLARLRRDDDDTPLTTTDGVRAPLSLSPSRRRNCLVCFACFALSSLSVRSSHFSVLVGGRVLAGVASSLLQTAFDGWMIAEVCCAMEWKGTGRRADGCRGCVMEWKGREWKGMEGNGRERNGTARPTAGRSPRLCHMEWNGMEWNGSTAGRSPRFGANRETTRGSIIKDLTVRRRHRAAGRSPRRARGRDGRRHASDPARADPHHHPPRTRTHTRLTPSRRSRISIRRDPSSRRPDDRSIDRRPGDRSIDRSIDRNLRAPST